MVISLHLPHPDKGILPPQVGLVIGTSPQSAQPGPLPFSCVQTRRFMKGSTVQLPAGLGPALPFAPRTLKGDCSL